MHSLIIDLGYDDVLDDYVLTSNISSVTYLSIESRNISDLTGIEDFVALERLYCLHNQLTSLDVSNNPALAVLLCWENQLTSLDVSNNSALLHLKCANNQLTSLNVSNNPALTILTCDQNQLTSLDLSNSSALTRLECGNNQLTSLDISNNPALTWLDCSSNQLTSLDLSNKPALERLYCGGNQLTSLDVSNNPALTELLCWENQLTSLDMSNCPALTRLYCWENQLTSLDISNNPALWALECVNNQLASLDVSNNPALTHLHCWENQLTSLDVSNNSALTRLGCHENQLTSLNVKNGNNVNFEYFSAINNPNLTCIQVDDAAWSTANWSNKDATATYSENCNPLPIPCPGIPTVSYGGQIYNTVQIGDQCWMKENLNIGTRVDGVENQTDNGIIEKYCYNDLESNCDVYGGLYQWNEIMQYITIEGAQGICPSGWHIPSDIDFNTLENFLGGVNAAGGKLKESGYTHWSYPNTGATNSSGFTGLPGGRRDGENGTYHTLHGDTYFWSSLESSQYGRPENAVTRYLIMFRETFDHYTHIQKNNGLSVRCLKDTCTSYSPVGVSITASTNPVCAGSSVIFTATPTNGGTYPIYKWKVNGVIMDSDSSSNFTYVPLNNDVVNCLLISNLNCTNGNPASSNYIVMNVITIPSAPESIIASVNPICSGTSTILQAVGGSGETLTWHIGNCEGTTIGTGTSITVAPSISLPYLARYENQTCFSPCASITINVNPTPWKPSLVAFFSTICPGNSTTIYAQMGSGTTKWFLNSCNGPVYATGSSLTVSPTVTTTYYARNETSYCVSACSQATISVIPVPPPTAVIASVNPVCIGSSTVLTASGGGNGTLKWYMESCGGIFVGTGATITVNPLETTTYYVRYENTTCFPSSCASITVIVVPSPAPTVTGPITVCQNTPGNIYSTEPGMAGYSWTASPGGLITSGNGTNQISIVWSQTGPQTVGVSYSNGNGCTSVVPTVNPVIVSQNPSVNITAVPSNSIFTGGIPTTLYLGYGPQSVTLSATATGGSGFTYSWTSSTLGMAGLTNPTSANPVFTPTEEGRYVFTLTVTNSNGCSASSSITICVMDIRVPNQNNKV